MAAMTDPVKPSWRTGEFWASLGAGAGILFVAFHITNDQQVIDIATRLFVQALTGLGAMITLAALAITMMNKRTDLKTAMIENNLVTVEDDEEETVVAPIDAPVEPIVMPTE